MVLGTPDFATPHYATFSSFKHNKYVDGLLIWEWSSLIVVCDISYPLSLPHNVSLLSSNNSSNGKEEQQRRHREGRRG